LESLNGNVDADGKIIFDWIFIKYNARMWIVFICLRVVSSGGLYNETSSLAKGRAFLAQLCDHQLHKEGWLRPFASLSSIG
jgi:hypothetical protein